MQVETSDLGGEESIGAHRHHLTPPEVSQQVARRACAIARLALEVHGLEPPHTTRKNAGLKNRSAAPRGHTVVEYVTQIPNKGSILGKIRKFFMKIRISMI